VKVKDTAAITPPSLDRIPLSPPGAHHYHPVKARPDKGTGCRCRANVNRGSSRGVQKRREAMDQGMTGGKSLAAFAGFLMMESRFSDDDPDKRASDPALLERRESAAHSHEASSSPTTSLRSH
jgi:hypothetical protein